LTSFVPFVFFLVGNFGSKQSLLAKNANFMHESDVICDKKIISKGRGSLKDDLDRIECLRDLALAKDLNF